MLPYVLYTYGNTFQVPKWVLLASRSWANHFSTQIWFVVYWNSPTVFSYLITENLEHRNWLKIIPYSTTLHVDTNHFVLLVLYKYSCIRNCFFANLLWANGLNPISKDQIALPAHKTPTKLKWNVQWA